MSGIELFARTSVYDFNLSDRYALPYLARDSSIPVSTSLLFSKLLMVITPSGDSHTRTVGVSIRDVLTPLSPGFSSCRRCYTCILFL
ncbi:hypothetical protein Y032_0240g3339 [Ancylostoma ceylanicum]|uniref:Uncharacterized protein n=1 Tax=Ancylostoma ceylanicum TaxID=53326 RepID=A0A016SEM2_9BILA|nr:hypothetical protein Y032_0240g3339 [Ancylostoma ceylanicum]